MHAFTVHPEKKPETTEAPPRRRWRRGAALVALLFGIVGVVWAVRPDPHLARARELQKELFGADGKNLTKEERKARFAEYREQVKQLSPEQKRELSAPMREKQKADMDRYFAMTPKEKSKHLDDLIDRSEKMRKEREQKAAQGNANGPRGNAGPAGAPVGNKAGGGPSVGQGGGPARTPEEIEKRRKQFLEQTTPEERARMDQFRKEMNDRRKQRGLPVRA